ncbi:hypothetical protein [Ruegeria sp. HKCCD6109]|uniref:hypothetical protein n=1 Tax=Ruegeria sp. HKCCD6109 TaxID=2683017 RepID=UPI0014909893|nr:hypothetical protein [Ruegeria sp. HKCCD6109]NOD65802.1 hypothetical protein [Ruegeria sp. HKCCD6109]
MAGRKGEKFWADAVKRAVHRRLDGDDDNPQKLELIADALVDAAMDGDIQAVKEIGDRLDGKAVSRNEHSGPGGGDIPHKLTVETTLVAPKGKA